MTRAIFISVALTALAGCGFPAATSSDVSTRDIGVHLQADNDGGGTIVSLDVTSPLSDFTFVNGDALQITAGGVTRPITPDEPVNLGDASGPLVIDLVRPSDLSARGLTAEMPPPFTLTAPPVTATQPIELSWEKGEGEYATDLAVSGACISAVYRALTQDTGAYTIQTAELMRTSAGVTTCPLTVTLRRSSSAQAPMLPTAPTQFFHANTEQNRTIELSWSNGP